jgi:hypothetical protein
MEPIADQDGASAGRTNNMNPRHKPEKVAWLVLSLAFAVFLALCGTSAAAAYFYRTTATEDRPAKLELIDGDSVFVREQGYTDWRQANNGMAINEGDSVRTGNSSRALVTLFDSSTVLMSRNTEINFTELKTSRYISRAKYLKYSQPQGSTRIGVAMLEDYSSSTFEVTTPHSRVILQEPGGSYLVEVEPTSEKPYTRVEARRGMAYVIGQGATVSVGEEEKTIVNAGSTPASPTSAQRELLANSTFTKNLNHWTEVHDHGGDSGDVNGTVTLSPADAGGKQVQAVEFKRTGGNLDYASTGIHQEVNADVVDFINLRLKLDAKIIYQSLSGGGSQSTEYPLMVRVKYLDSNGNAQERYRGFFYQNEDNNPTKEGQLVEQNIWQTLQLDLRDLSPSPVYIKSLDIFAAGHDYDSLIANVSLSGD